MGDVTRLRDDSYYAELVIETEAAGEKAAYTRQSFRNSFLE